MKRLLFAAACLTLLRVAGSTQAQAQSLDGVNLQIHGYATQGFLYSNDNSWNTTASENGSAAWTDVVVNLGAQPDSRLRIGVQARYFLLGNSGNKITLDWAQADFKVNERFGIRVGKVKSPIGLLNESQDIDPSQLWVLLPQGIYPLASRDSLLSHYGTVVYGSLPLGEALGKLEYRGFAGERVLSADDGYFLQLEGTGISVTNGIAGHTSGGTLRWVTPIEGLIAGVSEDSGSPSGRVTYGPYTGNTDISQFRRMYYFSRLERGNLMLAAEYNRFLATPLLTFPGGPTIRYQIDTRPWYLMGSYRIAAKLAAGMYYSHIIDHGQAYTSAAYQKDWAVTARYDFSPFFYAKLEQHWMDGTQVGFAPVDNPNLQPSTRMTLLKIGASF